ncbi:MAG TPA: 5-oxoprolinase subunit PxpA [Chitinophagaceae bacterium]|nr:5-oxoprolinase subunit PxpA [Chitinophagaceae bacterium]
MRCIDINCDMGEGMDNDAALMPYISSANIACGYHAGNEETMQQTVDLACRHGVAIGAHVSFWDKENFGRKEMDLPQNAVYELVQQQLIGLQEIVKMQAVSIKHVKPHGALYNMSARDKQLAGTIARAVNDLDPSLVLVGLSGSHSINEAKKLGLQTASEVFADRRYEENGSLRSRSLPGALLEDAGEVADQVLQMVSNKTVISITGKEIPVTAETICIHGDGKHAVEFAQTIYQNLKNHSIEIKPF